MDCETFSTWLYIMAALGYVLSVGLALWFLMLAIGRLWDCLAQVDEPVTHIGEIKRPIFTSRLWWMRKWL